jgi:hypothetical protein
MGATSLPTGVVTLALDFDQTTQLAFSLAASVAETVQVPTTAD